MIQFLKANNAWNEDDHAHLGIHIRELIVSGLKAYKESIFDLYKTKVLVNGKPSLSKHNAFIESYKEPLRVFFKTSFGSCSIGSYSTPIIYI